MRKALKILAILVTVAVLAVVALVVLVRVFVTPERVKAVVLPKAQQALHREVTLGEIRIGLFTGIELRDLVVREREGTEPFVSAGRAVLKFQLWPLLSRRVVIDEARLERPLIRIERLADGRFNFSDLLEEGPEEVAPSTEKEEAGLPVDLLVSEVAIQGGEVLFLDHLAGKGKPLEYRLSAVDFTAQDISLESPFPWQAQARLNDGRLSAAGRVDPRAQTGEASVEIDGLDVVAFEPYFRDAFPGTLNALRVSVKASAAGGTQRLSSRGEVRLEGIDLFLQGEEGEPLSLKEGSVRLDYGVEADLPAGTAVLEPTTLTFNGLPLTVAGSVAYADAPSLKVRLTVPELDLNTVPGALPQPFRQSAAQLEPGGRLSAWAELEGEVSRPQDLLRRGEVVLKQVGARFGDLRPALDGTIQLGLGTVRAEGLILQLGENRASIDFQVANLFGDVIQVTSALQSERLALDPLLGAAGAAGEPSPAQKTPAESGAPTGIDLPLRAEGTVRIGQTVYKGLSVNDFSLRYLLEKNVLSVQQLSGSVAGGSFRGEGRADLGKPKPPFQVAFDLKGLQADPLVTAFLPGAAGTVFGNLDLQTQVEGQGIEALDIRRTLTGKGALLIRDGRLTGAGLVQGLATFLDLEELRVLRFSEAKGNFTARNGQLLLNSTIDGSDVRMRPQGTIALENFALDLALEPRFSPALTRKLDSRGRISQFVKDEQGWAGVPIRVTGTPGAPRFGVDTTAVRQQLQEKASQELRQRLDKEVEKLLPRQKEETPSEKSSPEKPGRILEETFKGLFGN